MGLLRVLTAEAIGTFALVFAGSVFDASTGTCPTRKTCRSTTCAGSATRSAAESPS
jgi:hypothetical protein